MEYNPEEWVRKVSRREWRSTEDTEYQASQIEAR